MTDTFASETYSMQQFSVEQTVNAVGFSPSGDRIAFATDAGSVVIFNTLDGKHIAELRTGDAGSLAWSPDGSLFMVGSSKRLAFWDASYSKQVAAIPTDAAPQSGTRAKFSPDSKRVVIMLYDGTAAVWEINVARQVALLKGHTDQLTDASFSPDGSRIVTSDYDHTARVWDASTGSQIAVLEGHEKVVRSARFSPDGTRVLTVADDQTARVWDAASGTLIAVLRHSDGVEAAAFDREGKRVVTGSDDGAAHVFDAGSGEEITTLKDDGADQVLSATFSPDGTRIATGSSDLSLRIFDVASGRLIDKLNAGMSDIISVRFSDDGGRLFAIPHGAAGIVFTSQQQEDVRLEDGIAGIWGIGPPDGIEATAEDLRVFCSTSPYIVHPDGLVEFLVGGEGELLQPRQFMRCKADLTCGVFEGAISSIISTPVDKATFTFVDGKGTMCMASDPDNCQTLRKCPKLEWDDAARASGHAEQWDKLFRAAGN
ncbi:WD40 repeat domain-containing protein [Mesorhizobium loti]|uniref:WD40 repeat domain-containing protein n=1 Tax=Rhizobium loti TaxID=381 RepID=UPI001AEC5856|nr:WD40 repeat domain-containing protein [Mesorhizobium loti]